MKIQHECVPCLFKRIIFEAEQSTDDPIKKDKALQAAALAFSKIYSQENCSADIATKVHQAAYNALGDNDPYKSLKELSNTIALSLIPRVNDLVAHSKDPLTMSILCAIVGNTLDFGIDGGSDHPNVLLNQFQKLVSEGFGYDDTALVKQYLEKSENILFFTDNCGEIVFDKLVLQQIKHHYPECSVTLVVKGTPILSDATRDDVKLLHLDEIVDTVLDTGCFAVGINVNEMPQELRVALEQTDFIICKGMANYEVFSEFTYHPIAYCLRSKCQPIASSMGVSIHKNIVKVYP